MTLTLLVACAVAAIAFAAGWLAGSTRAVNQRHQLALDLAAERAASAVRLEAEQKLGAEKLSLLREADNRLREAFASLSADALRSNSQSFLDLARTSLAEYQRAAVTDLQAREQAVSEMVKPLRESLDKVGATLHQVEKDRAGAYSALVKQIEMVAAGQQGLQAETAHLVKALREPKARGRWGEIQLRRVVELAGMLDHCDFFEQQSMATEESRLVPDLVVQLPGDRQVIVDAKVPLSAYLQAIEAHDDDTRDAHLKEHARQVRDHMKRLAAKAYWEQVQPAPEFVVMFLPGEPFFSAALLHDPALIEWGAGERVILASPITLIALLRAVAYGWHQERIAGNAQQISDLGREMYDRMRVVAEHVEHLGTALNRAVEAYNQTVGSMETRLLTTARRLKELGAGNGKELPAVEGIDRVARDPRIPEPAAGAGDEVETT
jgi:DNA recombination protein RmuC